MRSIPYGYQPQQMQALHGGIANETENRFPENLLAGLSRNAGMQLPQMDGYGEAVPQVIEERLCLFSAFKIAYLH